MNKLFLMLMIFSVSMAHSIPQPPNQNPIPVVISSLGNLHYCVDNEYEVIMYITGKTQAYKAKATILKKIKKVTGLNLKWHTYTSGGVQYGTLFLTRKGTQDAASYLHQSAYTQGLSLSCSIPEVAGVTESN